jgi:hypothetical protein
LATQLAVDETEALARLTWLADRGFVEELSGGVAGLGGDPRWRITLRARGQRIPTRAAALLGDL